MVWKEVRPVTASLRGFARFGSEQVWWGENTVPKGAHRRAHGCAPPMFGGGGFGEGISAPTCNDNLIA